MEALQRVLGHSTVRLTERYGRLSPLAVAAEVARVSSHARDRSPITGTVDGTVPVLAGSESRK